MIFMLFRNEVGPVSKSTAVISSSGSSERFGFLSYMLLLMPYNSDIVKKLHLHFIDKEKTKEIVFAVVSHV